VVHIFVRDGATWSDEAYLKASNAGALDRFGVALALDGDTLVVGAPFEDSKATGIDGDEAHDGWESAGAAYIFVRGGTTWQQRAYVKPSNTGAYDRFGGAVAIAGDTVAIGAAAEDSASTGVGGDPFDDGALDAGAAYVFVRSPGSWTQQAYLKPSNTGALDRFGFALGIAGDKIVVGAVEEDGAATGVNGDGASDTASAAGAAYVFVRSGTRWQQQAYLKGDATDADDWLGFDVALDGDVVVLGAPTEDGGGSGSGGDPHDDSIFDAGAGCVFVVPCGTLTAYGTGCAGSGGFLPALGITGCATGLGTLELVLADGLGGAADWLFAGTAPGALPLGGGCSFLVAPSPRVALSGFFLGGAGAGGGTLEVTAALPAAVPVTTLVLQAAVLDPGSPLGAATSNGVEIAIR
jgi:hypothetical protein